MKNTRRSLLTSAICLLLCFSMLLGTTFAWFTDMAASNDNVVKSGELNAEMYWSDSYLSADASGWKRVNGDPIFTYDNWEPGYTDIKYIKVENAGDLAFKWRLTIEAAGELTELADVIDVYYVNPVDATLTALDGKVSSGSLRAVINSRIATTGVLLPEGESASCDTVLAIALHMDKEAGNKYQDMSIGDGFSINLVATQYDYESDAFGSGYDTDAEWPIPAISGTVTMTAPVTRAADDTVAAPVTLTSENGKLRAIIPAGAKLAPGVTELTAVAKDVAAPKANIVVSSTEVATSLDFHVYGLAADNDVPVRFEADELLPRGLNVGNYDLYHVENGTTNRMTLLGAGAASVHNGYEYDPATGNSALHLATFSEIALVADTVNAWEGSFDDSWYDADATELYIANADQLATLSAIVGGMKFIVDDVEKQYAADSFASQTITLLSDINLGDKESENNPDLIFYPIGYYNSEGTYEKTGTAITSGMKNFEGTFDGDGHTIANVYQNTWEMKGDHDWYDATLQYYRDGMGIFGRVYKGTIKNLTVSNFSSDGEITTTGVIAAYADGATFENIAIFNCNPRVYNIGNGGIVGCVGWYAKEAELKTTFTNITVDNTNKISALWGSYDVACGGIVGQYYPTSGQTSAGTPANGGIVFTNCHVSAQMDVYNDVCANYQYYAYRYTGMLIGSVRENVTIEGRVYPKMDGITASGCTVHFGDWNDYYYCEIVANSLASYTHDHQFSRLTQVASVDVTNKTVVTLDGKTQNISESGWAHYVVVKAKDDNGKWVHGDGANYATCYHFNNGEVWTHDKAGTETVNGVEGVLKEDKQLVYLEFNNLVTGYGWGVTTKGVDDMDGVTILDRKEGNSVEKFKSNTTTLFNNKVYTLGQIFSRVENTGVDLLPGALMVAITNLDENNPVSMTFVRDINDWANGTVKFTGTGTVAITIQDYYFCTPTTIEVEITERQPEEKFDVIFNNGDFLHRVGNSGTVALDKLFKAKDGVTVGTVSVTVEAVDGSSASGTYSNNAIQFSGTGVVKVSVTDNDYCIPTELILEVVDGTNTTGATSATSGNVVLLGNISNGFTVSGRYTFYGNGFTLNYTGNGQYLNNGLKQGLVTVSENGTVDNLRIIAPVYPKAYMYYGTTSLGDYVQGGPSSIEGDKTRYHYQLSAIAASGNATISNCYVYGGRNNIFVNTGDVTIKDTILECGTVANVQIQSSSAHTVTLENLTTIQYQVNPTIWGTDTAEEDKAKVMLGAGILIGPETNDNPKLVLNGDFKQYNWVTSDDTAVSGKVPKAIVQGALDATAFNHTVNGKTASNLGIIYMNEVEANIKNNTGLPYVLDTVSMTISGMTVNGRVYSVQGATEGQIYFDYENADRFTANGLYAPQFSYPSDLGGQYVAEGGDEHLYREGDTIYVMFPSGDTKEVNLATLVNILKYTGQDLALEVACKDIDGNPVSVADGKVNLSEMGKYTVTYTVIDTLFYDKDGNAISGSESYSWDVTIYVSLKDLDTPNAYYDYVAENQVMGYAKKSVLAGGNTQYLPFLAGLKIYDYIGQEAYLRFDGDNDFNKIASATITGYTSANHVLIEVKLVDGGVISVDTTARAASGGSTYTGTLNTSGNTLYYVNGGTTSATTTTWVISNYSFVGNNGVTIDSGAVTFSNCENGSVPTGSFGTTINYTVSYEANGGTCGQTVNYATSVSTTVTLPTPTRPGYLFSGWYTAASGGAKVGDAGATYTPSANITLYAQWGKPSTVTYNANGGSCGTTSEYYQGTALTLPTPTRDLYWFTGWYDAEEGGNRIGNAGESYNPASDITLYAHWSEMYGVQYDANGGTCDTEYAIYEGVELTLPSANLDGKTFLGWYTAATGGERIGGAGNSYIPTANIKLYAQYQDPITVTYDANGGTCGTASATYAGAPMTLPTPTKEGHTFLGWYTTADENGTKIGGAGSSYTPTASITLYAQWQINSYTITVTTSNATVSGVTDGQKVNYGTQITITVEYTGSMSKQTLVNGTKVTLSNNQYTFTVEGETTINASSSTSCVTADTLVTLADGTQKRIDQVTYDDLLLVWDFDKGEYAYATASIIENHGYGINEVIVLNFEDGTTVKVVNVHGFFNADLNKWVDIDAENAESFIGNSFTTIDGNSYKTTKLVSVEIYEEYLEAWSILSADYYNCFLEGMFSVTPPATLQLAFFEIGADMKYDAEAKQADIEKYGLYSYDEFAHLLSKEAFEVLNVAEIKIAVGKGMITYEELLWLIATYA